MATDRCATFSPCPLASPRKKLDDKNFKLTSFLPLPAAGVATAPSESEDESSSEEEASTTWLKGGEWRGGEGERGRENGMVEKRHALLAAVACFFASLALISLSLLPPPTNYQLTCFFLPFPAGTVAFLAALARAGMVGSFLEVEEKRKVEGGREVEKKRSFVKRKNKSISSSTSSTFAFEKKNSKPCAPLSPLSRQLCCCCSRSACQRRRHLVPLSWSTGRTAR